MICIKCNSENTQKLRLIYESGTTNLSMQSTSVGAGRDMVLSSAFTSTSGTSQSILAERVSPPKKHSYLAARVLVVVGLLLIVSVREFSVGGVALGLLGALILGFSIFVFRGSYKHNTQVFPKEYAEWSNTWHCNKCGTIYVEKSGSDEKATF